MSHSPLLYWHLSDSSGTTAVDSSGNGRDGTYVNGPGLGDQPLLAGESLASIYVDKFEEQRVELAYSSWMNSDAVTVTCLYRCAYDSSTLEVLASRYYDDTDDVSWLVYYDAGEFKLYYRTAGGQNVWVNSGVERTLGATYYVAAYAGASGAGIRIYSEGVLLGSATGTAAAVKSSARPLIVASADASSSSKYPITGLFQELSYFWSVLSTSDIDTLAYAATTLQPKWRQHTAGVAPRNGTNTHTLTFPVASAGALLVAVVAGSITSTATTPGWTKQVTAIESTEAAVFTLSASGGETSFSLTHNAADGPLSYALYEFPAGSTWAGGASNDNGPAPALSGLPGTPVMVFTALAMESGSPSNPTPDTAWGWGWHEDVDSMTIHNGITNGIYLTIGWRHIYTETSTSPGTDGPYAGPIYHISSQISSLQSVVFAVATP